MPENTPELIQHLEPVLEAQVSRIMLMLKGSGFIHSSCTSPLPACRECKHILAGMSTIYRYG